MLRSHESTSTQRLFQRHITSSFHFSNFSTHLFYLLLPQTWYREWCGYGNAFPVPVARSLGNYTGIQAEYRSAAYIHTFVTYRLPPHAAFFSYLIATFPLSGLYVSQMVHLIPYDIDP